MKEQLTITELIDMMIRRWWILAITAISLAVATFAYTEIFMDPLYRTDGTLYVNAHRTQSSDVSTTRMSASQQLVNTYKEILRRRTFLAQVSADLDNRYSTKNLSNMISMSSVNNTEILEITVIGKVPEDVYKICHSVLTHAPDELIRVINAGAVKILDDGQIPTTPVAPNARRNTLIAFLIGIVLGGFLVLLLELFDTRIKSREDIIHKYEEPLLGEIPELIPQKKAGADK